MKIIRVIIAGMLAGTCCVTARAGIVVNPQRMELSAAPGTTERRAFSITNPDREDITVEVEIKPWYNSPGNERFAIQDWMNYAAQRVEVAAGATAELPFTVTVPAGAAGELSCINTFKPVNTSGQSLNLVMSIPTYVTVKGSERIGAEARKVDIAAKRDPAGAGFLMTAAVTVANTGNIHVRPGGEVTFFKGTERVGTITIKQGWPVFPGQEYIYFGAAACLLPAAGAYRAEAVVTLEDGTRITRSVTFTLRNNARVTVHG